MKSPQFFRGTGVGEEPGNRGINTRNDWLFTLFVVCAVAAVLVVLFSSYSWAQAPQSPGISADASTQLQAPASSGDAASLNANQQLLPSSRGDGLNARQQLQAENLDIRTDTRNSGQRVGVDVLLPARDNDRNFSRGDHRRHGGGYDRGSNRGWNRGHHGYNHSRHYGYGYNRGRSYGYNRGYNQPRHYYRNYNTFGRSPYIEYNQRGYGCPPVYPYQIGW